MKRAIVITIGAKMESLGALKLVNWLRRHEYDVRHATEIPAGDADLFCFSAIFSWHLPRLVEMVNMVKNRGEVWIGGPAITFSASNAEWVKGQTGVQPSPGLDKRFDREPGDYPMVYFSRGCPAYTPACGNCPVPRVEGTSFTYYPDSKPAQLLLDNNLSALPAAYQDHIIKCYSNWKGPRVDCNSGFEPHSFTQETLDRWKKFPLAFWRFGYDDLSETDEAMRMMNLLKKNGIWGRRVRVYTMIGNEPIADCISRIQRVINFGFWPWPQRVRPLDWREGPLPVKFDWDEPTLIAVQRFYSLGQLWHHVPAEDWKYQGRYPLRGLVTSDRDF